MHLYARVCRDARFPRVQEACSKLPQNTYSGGHRVLIIGPFQIIFVLLSAWERGEEMQTTREAKLLNDSSQTVAPRALYRIVLAPPAMTTQVKVPAT